MPAGTLLGELSGRRTAFAAVGGLGLIAPAVPAVLLGWAPHSPSSPPLTAAATRRTADSH